MTLTTFIEEKKKELYPYYCKSGDGCIPGLRGHEDVCIWEAYSYEMYRNKLDFLLESSLKELAHRMIEELPEAENHRLIWNSYRTEAIRKFKEFIGE